ncbi:MAG: hypothetical protein RMM08_00955 [Armatimonadota bacterium]|nr:hypothetical protein [Armatimonadota bacterium]
MLQDMVLGIDPGRSKVGVAIVQSDGRVLHRAVLAVDEFAKGWSGSVSVFARDALW